LAFYSKQPKEPNKMMKMIKGGVVVYAVTNVALGMAPENTCDEDENCLRRLAASQGSQDNTYTAPRSMKAQRILAAATTQDKCGWKDGKDSMGAVGLARVVVDGCGCPKGTKVTTGANKSQHGHIWEDGFFKVGDRLKVTTEVTINGHLFRKEERTKADGWQRKENTGTIVKLDCTSGSYKITMDHGQGGPDDLEEYAYFDYVHQHNFKKLN